jgi:Holliday junction resolvasome RuvABC endonuclease subunit
MIKILGIDPNQNFLSCGLLNEKQKIEWIGNIDNKVFTAGLDKLVDEQSKSSTGSISCFCIEAFQYYGKKTVLGQPSIMTIESIGRVVQYGEMRGIKVFKFTRPQINQSLSGRGNSSEGYMQDVIRMRLGLKKNISPEHLNASICASLKCLDDLKAHAIQL